MDLLRQVMGGGRDDGEDSGEEDRLLENEDYTSSEEEEDEEGRDSIRTVTEFLLSYVCLARHFRGRARGGEKRHSGEEEEEVLGGEQFEEAGFSCI